MRYEWDEKKNRLNQKKHGISFEIAAVAFETRTAWSGWTGLTQLENNDGTPLGQCD